MSLPVLVQFKAAEPTSTGLTFDSTPTPGNLLVICVGGTALTATPALTGFTVEATALNDVGTSFFRRSGSVQTRVVQSGDGATFSFSVAFSGVMFGFEFSDATFDSIVALDSLGPGLKHQFAGGALTPTSGTDLIVYGYSGVRQGNGEDLTHTSTPDTPWTQDWFTPDLNWNYPQAIILSRAVTGSSGSYTPGSVLTLTGAANGTSYFGFTFAIAGSGAPGADFTVVEGQAGETTAFTDTSTNVPTSWAWDFGDGGTSTSQNPTHVYAVTGTYSVSLTATNADGSGSMTHSVIIVAIGTPAPTEPAGVLLEIYAAAPGSARWDVAKWDVDSWGEAGWRDVTPYGVTVEIDWGSSRPELGILSVPEAASWSVDYYDPDRILDPANPDGPYFGDLIPFLPIRVSHRGTVVRRGYASGIAHSYAKGARHGYMRGADNVSILANAQVPPDTTLPNTLYARAVAAIEAAGLSVTVAAPIGTDPAVTPWVTGTREWSVWQWISDAAQEVLHIPIVDRLGTVTFRAWASPLARGRSLGSPELIDLQAVTDYAGLYSVIQAREDEDTVIERALTPAPRYGRRTYTRNEDTLDPGAWADAVLADRAGPALLWKPGDLRPLTAVSTELLATIEAVELVGLEYPEADPAIFASGIVVGGHISIVGKNPGEAIWRFHYEVAQTPTEPLIETGGDPIDYLLRTGGGEYLFPTGSA